MPTELILSSLTVSELDELISKAIRTELEKRPSTVIQPPPEDEFLSREEAAKLLKISLGTLNDRMRKKELPYSRSGRRILFLKADLVKFLKENMQ